MASSMTGYGEGQAETDAWAASARIKTLNHRYLDISVKGLDDHDALELAVRRLVESKLHRGRAEVHVSLTPLGDDGLRFDLDVARDHWHALQDLASELDLGEPVTLDHLARFGRAFVPVPPDTSKVKPAVTQAVEAALEAVQTERTREGHSLADELRAMLQSVGAELGAVREAVPDLKSRYRETLQSRLSELAPNVEIDPGRIEQEVALIVERADITEELDRLEIHREAAESALDEDDGPIGRRLDFLGQEMYREVNTMTSKAKDGEIARCLVDIKAHIEHFREQVRNIE